MESYPSRVTLFEDGSYRWHYVMDMRENTSILYTLEKVNLFVFVGVSVGGAVLTGIVEHDFSAPMVRGILVVGLILGALMALLYAIGYAIAAGVKGAYRIQFVMNEEGIELVWPDRVKAGVALGENLVSAAGAAMGGRGGRGHWRPTLDEVSSVRFASVFRCKSHPKWNMIDLSVPGGKFQVYAAGADFGFVESYILERLPERVRRGR